MAKKKKAVQPQLDVTVSNHGTVAIITPLTEAAKEWVCEHLSLESWQFWGGNDGFACEPRYVDHIVEGMINDGLAVAA